LSENDGRKLPNIVYLHTHDTGRHLSVYGAPVPAPNIERLAKQGMLFRQAFSAAPTCSPSRAALLTGQLPHDSGMLGLAHRGFRLSDPRRHLATFLRDLGYRTATTGVEHVSTRPEVLGLGFTDQLLPNGRAEQISAAGADFIAEHHRDNPRQPFFLSVGFTETHTGSGPDLFGYPPRSEHVAPAPTLPSTPGTRADMGSFIAAAEAADEGMGRVLDALEQAGIAEETLVICTTDHGIPFPGMKGTLTDAGTGVLLVLRGPGGFIGGKSTDSMVSHLDIFPTIAELLGVPRPDWLQGVSLLPLAEDPAVTVRTETYAEVTYHAAYEPQRSIRTDRYRYVLRFADRDRPVLPNTDDSAGKRLWVEHHWADRPVAREALFDTLFDPHELVNLADDPASRAVLQDLRARMRAHLEKTDDPIRHGPVAAPDPGQVTNADQIDPRLPTAEPA
jgi:N-sulfoglucosamine sulfohydrolase